MNEFNETIMEIPKVEDFSKVSDQSDAKFSFSDLIQEVKDFVADTNDFIKELISDDKDNINIENVREYGLRECSDTAKEIFTPEVIREWGNMTHEQRDGVIQEYSKAIGDGLNIDFKGVVFEPLIEQLGALGYNSGDGYLHLDFCYLTDPSQIIGLIDTVAHEARHQFQSEAIDNPEKFTIDEATLNEWRTAREVYTTEYPTAYDPWGYTYNPLELDSKYFGETMVRELTKSIINNA